MSTAREPEGTRAALAACLSALDARLLRACDAEERRATLLAGDGSPGWAGVRNLARPPADDLDSPSVAEDPLAPPGHPVLDRLRADADLDDLACDVLVVLLAAHLEPRYQSLYAVLQDDLDQRRPTERLLVLLLDGGDAGRGRVLRALAPQGRLLRSGLVRRVEGSYPPLARPLELPDDVVAVLLGDTAPDPPGPGRTRRVPGTAAAPATTAELCVVHGAGDAVAVARSVVPPEEALLLTEVPPGPEGTAAARAAWRVALCTGVPLLIDLRSWPQTEVTAAVAQLEGLVRDVGGRAWLAARGPVPLAVPHREAVAPTWEERRAAWQEQAAAHGIALPDGVAESLASRHRLDAASVADVLRHTATAEEARLDRAARELLAAVPPATRRTWGGHTLDDLVLAPTTRDALERLVHFVDRRDRLSREQRLAARHRTDRGPLVLFAGRSGTGKTAAAEAVARALDRPLFTLDLSQLLSKYIGETEQHVDEVLRGAQQASGVLLCDEADALFSSRIEKAANAGEHFANVLVGYLLQRIEAHEGVVVLATNLRHAMDDAFLRRFRFRVEFPLPTAGEQVAIWELMLPPGVPRAADVDVGRLASREEVSGGDIANAALRAIFLADRAGGPVSQALLERAVALELMEQGRLSRAPAGAGGDRGFLLRALVQRVEAHLRATLRDRFLTEVHVVHGSPTEDQLSGRRPAVSLSLLRLAAHRGNRGVRAGLVASAWSVHPEEEYELIGVVHEALTALEVAEVAGRPVTVRVQESSDFDLLHRFWSSHDRPVRASVVLDVEIG